MSVTTFTAEELEAIEQKWTLPRFLFFPIGLFGIWFLAHPWPVDHWSVQAFWTAYLAYVMFCWTSCFHETAHQTLNGSRSLSIWLGRLLGILTFVPYTVYRESHIRHHAYLNKPSDWELWPYSDPRASLAFRRVFVWVDLFFGALTSPYIYGRTFFHPNSPIRSVSMRRTVYWEYASIVLFWGAIFTWVGWNGYWWGYLTVWGIPHLLAGVFQSVRKLTEHLGMKSYDPLLGTRTVLGQNLFTKVCTYLNFDIFVHGPHHRHPRIAHNQLEVRMREYMEESPETSYPVYQTYTGATLAMLPWTVRNPGVGMNVGAPDPNATADPEVDNFVQDVNREVLSQQTSAVA